MLHDRGLAYQAESLVNYDPIDETVLANEQVDANGCSWRSGAKVERVLLKQWFLKIKEYQEPLLNDLAGLAHNGKWPEKVLAMQRNWIGKSEGATIRFDVGSATNGEPSSHLDVFTTRADTLFGVQYIALSLGHPIVQREALGDARLRTFIEKAKDLPADSKEGYLLENVAATNPIAEQVTSVEPNLPVYVAPYVMGVPGHDTRDHAFWRANAGSDPIKVVIASQPGMTPSPLVPGSDEDKPMTERGFVSAGIDDFKHLSSDEAMRKILATLQSSGRHAKATENWRLRDWLISRQRYWGTPIPIIHCSSCGAVPVPDEALPVRLPNLPDSFFDGRKGNPLAEDENWKKTECPKCASAAERETDTMDTFMDSSWYFFRFLDPKNEAALLDPHKANKGMPVDLYVGGVEHAILHLLYARFISKFLTSTDTWAEGVHVNGEPFKQLITQGMVHGETFANPENGRFLRPDELDLTTPSAPRIKANGLTPTISYEKMSKSKHNGVDPGATITTYGADATRAHMLFQAPVGDVLDWDPKKITGVQRWLLRIVRLSTASWIPDEELARFEIPDDPDKKLVDIMKTLSENRILKRPELSNKLSAKQTEDQLLALLTPQDNKLWIKTQRIIASVNESYSQTYSLNTIVSDLMTLTNTIYDAPRSSAASLYLKWYSMVHLVRMAAPIAPGVAEEAWNLLNGGGVTTAAVSQDPRLLTVFASGFPVADLDIIPRLTRTTKCVVQVNGKRKFEVEIEKNFDRHVSTNRKNMSRWVLDQLLQTDEGKEWLNEDTGKVWGLSETKVPHAVHKFVPNDWNVIIVNDGRLCNLVSPKNKKAKKGDVDSTVKNTEVPAVVSHGHTGELEDKALKQHSNERSSTARDPTVGGRPPQHEEVDLQGSTTQRRKAERRPQLDHGSEQGTSGTARYTAVDTGSRLVPPTTTRVLPLQEVHIRIDALVETLPNYLKPRYIPPQVSPVPRPALLNALRRRVRRKTKGREAELFAQYERELSSFQTPPFVSSQYVVDSLPMGAANLKREQLVMSYNAIFPEQLALLSYAPATSFHKITLLSSQRQSIIRKLLNRRTWINNQVHVREQAQSGRPAKSLTTINELEVALGTTEHTFEHEVSKQGSLKYWSRGDAEKEADRVRDVWEEIVGLWAGLHGKKRAPIVEKKKKIKKKKNGTEKGKKKKRKSTSKVQGEQGLVSHQSKLMEKQGKDDVDDMGDWTWLVGKDQDTTPKESPNEIRKGPFKWG
jgi:leucyl-tRNA synthetase